MRAELREEGLGLGRELAEGDAVLGWRAVGAEAGERDVEVGCWVEGGVEEGAEVGVGDVGGFRLGSWWYFLGGPRDVAVLTLSCGFGIPCHDEDEVWS